MLDSTMLRVVAKNIASLCMGLYWAYHSLSKTVIACHSLSRPLIAIEDLLTLPSNASHSLSRPVKACHSLSRPAIAYQDLA